MSLIRKHLFVLKLGIFFLLIFTSCTIQKRTFNKGYFVQWTAGSKGVNLQQRSIQNTSSELTKNEVKDEKVEESEPINEIIFRDEIDISNESRSKVVFWEQISEVKVVEKSKNFPKFFSSFFKKKPLKSKVGKKFVKIHVITNERSDAIKAQGMRFLFRALVAFIIALLSLLIVLNADFLLAMLFLIFVYVFFLATLVFLIIGLALLLVGLVDENEQRIKS